MGKVTAQRYHDISVGHRVYGHESKCAHFHGHNYRIHFKISLVEGLDSIGRVLDFSVIKQYLCEWLESVWDHRFLLWEEDPHAARMKEMDPTGVVIVSFNPTAEQMAEYLVNVVAPTLFNTEEFVGCYGHVVLEECTIEETRKCSATYKLGTDNG